MTNHAIGTTKLADKAEGSLEFLLFVEGEVKGENYNGLRLGLGVVYSIIVFMGS